ncbi:hypothetical protein, partial [Kitasatospora sp. LaBMicrA B282]|uniref:hypothetical protein n=1 Tax=Kitasatospora sp. LaBMicrA B282 TaxID=3420949 RepID=UPI003D15297E
MSAQQVPAPPWPGRAAVPLSGQLWESGAAAGVPVVLRARAAAAVASIAERLADPARLTELPGGLG